MGWEVGKRPVKIKQEASCQLVWRRLFDGGVRGHGRLQMTKPPATRQKPGSAGGVIDGDLAITADLHLQRLPVFEA